MADSIGLGARLLGPRSWWARGGNGMEDIRERRVTGTRVAFVELYALSLAVMFLYYFPLIFYVYGAQGYRKCQG